ncbi:dephospho-CoA kinase [Pedobacter psychroterrae]|uniref:Dephospho-CoA kinase n=1 Tax=Pedobacter psychroterrae TaxID=2530453 RepID=A0A4R0NIP2_9SPHI|nr:dephospho-CoA kinase [Pedobacter psychroterrae]TCD00356.1 dephospho-CoA kinase [Pedobacter psychroterrae]
MLKIGITGGIGSGKTTICKIFEVLGTPVFYADKVARQIMVEDAVLIEAVKDTFGQESYFDNGALNNKHVAAIVFNNTAELEKLNALVHPAVFRAFDSWIEQVPQHIPYVLKEAALLFESGSYKMCDQSILVIAPEVLKLRRVTERDGITDDQVRARMDKQFTDEEKRLMADHIIHNNEQRSLIAQVIELHRAFLKTTAI